MKNQKIKFIAAIIISASIILGCEQTAALQQVSTPYPTDTPVATNTPLPTATLVPTMEPIPGWTRFTGGGAEIMLPDSYIGGDIKQDLDVIVARLREQGPDLEQMAQTIEQNPDMYVIWALDSKVGPTGFFSNVNVTTQPALSTVSVNMYMDATEQQLPPEFKVVARDTLDLSGYDAGQMVIEFEISGVQGKEIVYMLKDGSALWAITYAAGRDEYDQQFPIFELSAHTFRILSQ